MKFTGLNITAALAALVGLAPALAQATIPVKPVISVGSNQIANVASPWTSNQSLDLNWASPGLPWNGEALSSPGMCYSSPSVFARSTGEVDVVVQGPHNSLGYYFLQPNHPYNGGFQYAEIAGNYTTFSAPSIFVRPNGEADIVAQGSDNSLMYYWANPGTGWSPTRIALPNTTYSQPAIYVDSNGRAWVAAQGPNNSLNLYWANPGTSWSWQQVMGAGTTFSAPSLYVRPTGEIDIAVQGPSNSLTYVFYTPSQGFAPYTVAGPGTTFSDPSLYVRTWSGANNEADIVVLGPSGSLMYYTALPGLPWNTYTIYNNAASAPSIFVRPTGEADVVVFDPTETVIYLWTFQDNGGGWNSAPL